MKTKILFILLIISSITIAQNWTQVGATQFTNFASDAALTIHPSTGEPYVIYNNVMDGNKPYVMKFDGSNWVTIGTGAIISNEVRLANIAINPSTNEPNIAFKNITTNRIDIYKFDGTSWVAIETSLPGSDAIREIGKLSIQYDSNSNLFVFGHQNASNNTTNHLLRRYYNFGVVNNQGNSWWHYDEEYTIRAMAAFPTNYNEYLVNTNISHTATVQRSDVRQNNFAQGNYDFQQYVQPARLVKMVSVPGGNYWAGDNEALGSQTTQKIIFGYKDQTVSQPINTDNNTLGLLELAKDELLNKIYLMYSDNNHELQFQKFSNNTWSFLPALNISTNGSGFFSGIKFNEVDNNLYLMYLDGGKLSVKKYEPVQPLTKYYVNANVSGGNGSGDSWANAMTELSSAINNSGPSTTEIWVASAEYNPGTDKNNTFTIGVNNLAIYGGFDGTETSLSQRNLLNNPTILSGDLNNDDQGVSITASYKSDNSRHIFNIKANDIIIDGFTIEKGHAYGTTYEYGGAFLIDETTQNISIKNCKINENVGLTGGAIRAYYNSNSTITFENCVFSKNRSRYGSGAYILANNNRTVTANIYNCLFNNNYSGDNGSSQKGYTGSSLWIRANGSNSNVTTTITNSTFANNIDVGTQPGSNRGSVALSKRTDGNSTHNATINNSIFYNNEGASSVVTHAVNSGHTALPNAVFVNESIDQNGFSNLTYLTNTSNADPLFTDSYNSIFTLQSTSPAINAGNNTNIPSGITTDLAGNNRIIDTTVDMGCYEYDATASNYDFETITKISVYPNPTSKLITIDTEFDVNQVEIYSTLGQKMVESNNKTINVSRLTNGIYVMNILLENGKTETKQFIKK